MLIVDNKRYIKKHIVGGSGIFDKISGFFKGFISSRAAQSLAKAASTDIGKNAISAAKTVGKELATTAISKAKDVIIDKGKQFIDKKLTPKSTEIIKQITTLPFIDTQQRSDTSLRDTSLRDLTQKSKDILNDIINSASTININKLMMGQGSNGDGIAIGGAIRIEDLVRRNNRDTLLLGSSLRGSPSQSLARGSGLRLA